MNNLPQPIRDYVFFSIDQEYHTAISNNPDIILNDAIMTDDNGDEYDIAYQHKRIYGEVLAVPTKQSDLMLRGEYEGYGRHRSYVSGEDILEKVKMGLGETKTIHGSTGWGRSDYYPTTYEGPKKVTLKDLKFDLQVGDIIYFDYNTICKDNRVYETDENVYRVRLDQIYCAVREGEIIMQGGHVLAEREMETWDDITGKHGIIIRSELRPKPFLGFVRHIDPDNDYGIKVGDHIVYIDNADFECEIEGKQLCVMKEHEILAILQ